MTERPYELRDRVSRVGRSSYLTTCPFCEATVVIYPWSIAGNGKKKCRCGAALYLDGQARR